MEGCFSEDIAKYGINLVKASNNGTHLIPFFQVSLDKPVLEGQTILGSCEARDDAVEVALAEPHASHLHLTADR